MVEEENVSISDLINDLIPYFDEDLITFPLWEEGDYKPQVKTYYITKDVDQIDKIKNLYETICANDQLIDVEFKQEGIFLDVVLYYTDNSINIMDNDHSIEKLLKYHINVHKNIND